MSSQFKGLFRGMGVVRIPGREGLTSPEGMS